MDKSQKIFLSVAALGTAGCLFLAFQMANINEETQKLEQRLDRVSESLDKAACLTDIYMETIIRKDPQSATASGMTMPPAEQLRHCKQKYPEFVSP
ncbi:MAG: hypothetical protein H6867_03170 [Rhodospirillales bacterium]|nr:hypothetical protein [Rhodospirillales bacterium]MCB9996152.1 hypothetical protein [Rhodospirillales bacterium]